MRTLQQSSNDFLICADPAEAAREAARRFADLAQVFIADNGRFRVVLSGGSTPRTMFSILADAPFADSLPWKAIDFFWGDERCVPPDHTDSNYRMANETLLSKVGVPAENIYRIPAEDPDPHRVATTYSETIRKAFGMDLPHFDLVFLGMGADGHTASLFPGTAALNLAGDEIAVANYVEKFQAYRITLTAPIINHARNIFFLITGEDKAPALKEVIKGERNPSRYPSQLIAPNYGSLLWIVDEAAAGLLS
jgi:6-phosphogluconolactonase